MISEPINLSLLWPALSSQLSTESSQSFEITSYPLANKVSTNINSFDAHISITYWLLFGDYTMNVITGKGDEDCQCSVGVYLGSFSASECI